jgi:hypothetical protein
MSEAVLSLGCLLLAGGLAIALGRRGSAGFDDPDQEESGSSAQPGQPGMFGQILEVDLALIIVGTVLIAASIATRKSPLLPQIACAAAAKRLPMPLTERGHADERARVNSSVVVPGRAHVVLTVLRHAQRRCC